LINDFSSINDFKTLSMDLSFNLLRITRLFYITDIQPDNQKILGFFFKKKVLANSFYKLK
jgi:hypothetical protein